MRRLAQQTLREYALPNPRLLPVSRQFNTTFRIVSSKGEQYLLRICHPRRTSVIEARSETDWLTALRKDTDLLVPEPIPNLRGETVTVTVVEGVTQARLCILYRWVPGRFFVDSLTPVHLYRIGELTAHLHEHASHWKRPASFTRRRVDNLNTMLEGADDRFDPAVATRAVQAVTEVGTAEDGALVASAIERIWSTMQGLGEGPDVFGLIHADLHQWNVLFHKGQAGAIDFEDCGFGHYLYDFAVTLCPLTSRTDFAALQAELLAGYRCHRLLSTEEEVHISTFLALRSIQDMLPDIEVRSHPAFRDTWQRQVENALQQLRNLIGS